MKVGIIGLGLIGGSIALKLKDLFDNLTIYGYDIDHDSISSVSYTHLTLPTT